MVSPVTVPPYPSCPPAGDLGGRPGPAPRVLLALPLAHLLQAAALNVAAALGLGEGDAAAEAAVAFLREKKPISRLNVERINFC